MMVRAVERERFATAEARGVERQTQAIGQQLWHESFGITQRWFAPRYWQDRLNAWVMTDEAVKTALFRFVDVLPKLRDDQAVCDHLVEYLGPLRERLPTPFRWIVEQAMHEGWRAPLVARLTHAAVGRMARQFIGADDVPGALATVERLESAGRHVTLDLLGEAVITATEADAYAAKYRELLQRWGAQAGRRKGSMGSAATVHVSLKLSALDPRFDPLDTEGTFERVSGRLRPILRLARSVGAFVNWDMEAYESKDLTLDIFRRVLMEAEFREWADVGIVIQAYLRDAQRDLEGLAQWARERGTPVTVRLVKGAYWDYETIQAKSHGWPVPVFANKSETDANYERLTSKLLNSQPHLQAALASHNLRSVAHALAMIEELHTPPAGYEFQVLYGMAEGLEQALVDRGHRVRVYVPFGEILPGMAYLVRRLLENNSNESFLHAARESDVDVAELLEAPDAVLPRETCSVPEDEPVVLTPTNRTFQNEPLWDFSQNAVRARFQAALDGVATQLGARYPAVIEGREIWTKNDFVSINPSHRHQVVGRIASADHSHVDQAVAACQRALPVWHALGASGRAQHLRSIAALLRRERAEMAAWIVVECGKGWREADGDVAEAIDFCEYYALGAEQLEQARWMHIPGEENRFDYLPRGVAAVIAPWNFPLAILAGMTTAALATGNPVIMKPAETSSVVAAKWMDLCRRAGMPAGVLHLLPGEGAVVGRALVEHPGVAIVAFTGSREVGLEIHRRAAEISASGIGMVKRVIAEMGGKNAIIVDADADLDEATLGIMRSAFWFQGQKCSACSRLIVVREAYDELLARLVAATRTLQVGPAEDPASHIGPVIDDAALAKIKEYIDIGRREGREALAVSVGELAAEGFFVGPHIFADVPPTGRLAQEEVFGPVLVVLPAESFEQAIQIANGTPYALTAGVYSRSPAHLDEARQRLLAGNVYLNRPTTGALVGRQPFGGFKLSGIGSQAGGPDYLLQFVIPRTVTENTLRRGFAPETGTEANVVVPPFEQAAEGTPPLSNSYGA